MAVRWIGDAARELGIPVWDAIAHLSKEDAYPMHGLLDEERFQLLKHAAKRGVEASGSVARPAAAAAAPAAAAPPPPAYRSESTAVGPTRPDTTAVTAAMPAVRDRSEDKTVIYPEGGGPT